MSNLWDITFGHYCNVFISITQRKIIHMRLDTRSEKRTQLSTSSFYSISLYESHCNTFNCIVMLFVPLHDLILRTT